MCIRDSPYANGSIHLGHMLEYVQTDMWVRYQKLRGNQAIYVCADDAHGSAIMLRAEKEGITPEQLIDGDVYKRQDARCPAPGPEPQAWPAPYRCPPVPG